MKKHELFFSCCSTQDLDNGFLHKTELEAKLSGLLAVAELMKNIYEQVRGSMKEQDGLQVCFACVKIGLLVYGEFPEREFSFLYVPNLVKVLLSACSVFKQNRETPVSYSSFSIQNQCKANNAATIIGGNHAI